MSIDLSCNQAWKKGKYFVGLLCVFAVILPCFAYQRVNHTLSRRRGRQCDCMEYWKCVGSGGNPYSYCSRTGSGKVCCFVDAGAQSVGILPPKVLKKTAAECGLKGRHTDQEGVADPGEWAWHAAVLEKSQDLYVCGATLVDEFWVLTAAHCVDEYQSPSQLKIRLGEYDVSSRREPLDHEEFEVTRIVVHPGFDNRSLLNDVALLRLRFSARRRPHVNVVCMPRTGDTEKRFISSNRCFVTGWGKRTENGAHSVKLKEIRLPIWTNEECERAMKTHFGSRYKLPSTSICAGSEGRDACDGDGGGPLVCEKVGRWYQVGIVSFGIGCGRPNTPGIYTRVESYNRWIHNVVMNS